MLISTVSVKILMRMLLVNMFVCLFRAAADAVGGQPALPGPARGGAQQSEPPDIQQCPARVISQIREGGGGMTKTFEPEVLCRLASLDKVFQRLLFFPTSGACGVQIRVQPRPVRSQEQ